MPEQHNHNLDPALRELEAALGDMTPTGSNTRVEGSGQRDQLMFAMGQAATRQRTRRARMGSHIGTALIALFVGTLVTLPWRVGPATDQPGVNPGRYVKTPDDSGNSNNSVKTKDQEKRIDVVRDNTSQEVAPSTNWKLVDTLSKRLFERADDDERYVSVRQRVLEQGLDALPESSTGHATSGTGNLRHRGSSSGLFDLF